MPTFRGNPRKTELHSVHHSKSTASATTQSLKNYSHHCCDNAHQNYTSTFSKALDLSLNKYNRASVYQLVSTYNEMRTALRALSIDLKRNSYCQVNAGASQKHTVISFHNHIALWGSHPAQLQYKTLNLMSAYSALLHNFKCSGLVLHSVRQFHRKTHNCGTDSKVPYSDSKFSSLDGTYDRLTHTDAQGKASMVNISSKPISCRTATACGKVILGLKAFNLVRANQLAKGDALAVAQLAGIMGAKQTSLLIPLCHMLPLDHTSVTIELLEKSHTAIVKASCQTTGRTGVEMEALTAVTVATLALYDMCKSVSHDIVITDIKLLSKTGGQGGDFQAF